MIDGSSLRRRQDVCIRGVARCMQDVLRGGRQRRPQWRMSCVALRDVRGHGQRTRLRRRILLDSAPRRWSPGRSLTDSYELAEALSGSESPEPSPTTSACRCAARQQTFVGWESAGRACFSFVSSFLRPGCGLAILMRMQDYTQKCTFWVILRFKASRHKLALIYYGVSFVLCRWRDEFERGESTCNHCSRLQVDLTIRAMMATIAAYCSVPVSKSSGHHARCAAHRSNELPTLLLAVAASFTAVLDMRRRLRGRASLAGVASLPATDDEHPTPTQAPCAPRPRPPAPRSRRPAAAALRRRRRLPARPRPAAR